MKLPSGLSYVRPILSAIPTTDEDSVFFCGVGRLWLYFVDTCTNKSDCSGGLRDSRTDCLLFIEALGSTRSCGQHGYLAATHHPPWWRIIRVHSNPIRIRFADTVLDSIRIRLVFARMDSRYLDSCPTLTLRSRELCMYDGAPPLPSFQHRLQRYFTRGKSIKLC
jgi:hypothetical protein